MSKRILVIDEDEGVRMSFTRALEDTVFQVATTERDITKLEDLKVE